MSRFLTILTFLLFSITMAGCTTPLIDIRVGAGLSDVPSSGGGGRCRHPCGDGGAKRAKAVEEAETVEIIHKRVTYYVRKSQGDPLELVSYELTQEQANFKEGDKVKVTRNDDDSVTFTKH